MPCGRIARAAYGAGSRELPGRPNVLRAVLIEPPEAETGVAPGARRDGPEHVLLETNVDDMSPSCWHTRPLPCARWAPSTYG